MRVGGGGWGVGGGGKMLITEKCKIIGWASPRSATDYKVFVFGSESNNRYIM